VAWIETMSAVEEVRSAANGAIRVGMPYTATCSFDTAGRTMMGLMPGDLAGVFDGLTEQPIAMGANCGVGASDILVSLLAMSEHDHSHAFISKGNCGIPQFRGTDIHYTGNPELMAAYARMAMDAGARIIGGCCGTSPEHLAAMRVALDTHTAGRRPTMDEIVAAIGPMVNSAPTATDPAARERRRRRD
jgi:5-methyltetrahydrofolate--homocysteine methyltransferase